MNQQLHKIFLSKILLDIYKNRFLSWILGFKWWTCAMFFYWLDRLSVDLDFDVINFDLTEENIVLISQEIKKILEKYWKITDFAHKKHTILFEFSYQKYERRVKIEISKRPIWKKTYVNKNFLWENVLILKENDLFAEKLVAFLHRKWIANRDLYDIYYFLDKWVLPTKEIIEEQSKMKYEEYLKKVLEIIKKYDFSKALYWLGELVDDGKKNFIKNKMKDRLIGYLEFLF